MTPLKIKSFYQLKKFLRPGEIVFDEPTLERHSGDKWFAAHRPDAVAFPHSTETVSKILRFAN